MVAVHIKTMMEMKKIKRIFFLLVVRANGYYFYLYKLRIGISL